MSRCTHFAYHVPRRRAADPPYRGSTESHFGEKTPQRLRCIGPCFACFRDICLELEHGCPEDEPSFAETGSVRAQPDSSSAKVEGSFAKTDSVSARTDSVFAKTLSQCVPALPCFRKMQSCGAKTGSVLARSRTGWGRRSGGNGSVSATARKSFIGTQELRKSRAPFSWSIPEFVGSKFKLTRNPLGGSGAWAVRRAARRGPASRSARSPTSR